MKTFLRPLLVIVTVCAVIFLVTAMVIELSKPSAEPKKVIEEQRINDEGVSRFDSIQVLILPSGERVLVMSGPEGLGACCLLPPLPPPTVEGAQ